MKKKIAYVAGIATAVAMAYGAHRWILHKVQTSKMWEKAGRYEC